jgi:PilZ domain
MEPKLLARLTITPYNCALETSMDPLRNKRRFQRYHCSLPIELLRYGNSYPLRSTTSDVCVGGCYVNLSSALRAGTPVDVVLWVGETKLAFQGMVRNADSNVGNGIAFTGMTDEQRSSLQRHLDQTATPTALRY